MKQLVIIFSFIFLLNGTAYSQMLRDSVFYYDAKMDPTSKKIAFIEKIEFTSDSSYVCILYDKKTNIVRRRISFTKEIPSSDWEYFDEKGNLSNKINYSADNYKPSSKCDSATMANSSIKFFNYVLKNVKYPRLAVENGIQGKVIYQFRLDEKGTLTKLSILKSNSRFFTEEVIRLMTNDVPSSLFIELSQKSCEAVFTLPLVFKMQM